MGDMGEVFKVMKEDRQERHQKWHEENRAVIIASGLTFVDRGETLLFRRESEKNIPLSADFYPSTGRWTSKGKTFRGGAKSFINWWGK